MMATGIWGQCSPNPLYYVVQKNVVVPLLRGHFNQSILWKYRFLSLVSGSLILVSTFGTVFCGLGSLPGILALFGLTNAGVFHLYSAESRPYMFWLLIFSASLLLAIFLGVRKESSTASWQKIGLTALLLSLALVSGGGGVQGLAILTGILFLKPKEKKWILPIALSVALVSWYYGRLACHYKSAGDLDLLETHNWALIRPVFEMFWLNPFHAVGLLSDLLLVCGLFLPLSSFFMNKLDASEKEKDLIRASHFHLWLQLGAGFTIGILVAINHYFFIGRVFIFLIFLKALALALGGFLLLRLMRMKTLILELGVVALLSVVIVVAVKGRKAAIIFESPKEIRLVSSTQYSCDQLKGRWLGYATSNEKAENITNSIVAFSKLLEECHFDRNSESLPTRYVLFSEGNASLGKESFALADSAPGQGFEEISQFGKKLPITP